MINKKCYFKTPFSLKCFLHILQGLGTKLKMWTVFSEGIVFLGFWFQWLVFGGSCGISLLSVIQECNYPTNRPNKRSNCPDMF